MATQPTKVFPVPGVFLVGEPMTVHEVETKGRAEELIKSGAFAASQSEADALSPFSKEAVTELRAAEKAEAEEAEKVAATEDKAGTQPATDQGA